jgi:hypothetical protein
VLAPNAPWRAAVVARLVPEDERPPAAAPSPPGTPSDGAPRRRVRPKYRTWAELMRRAFEADVLACPRCGGRMVVLSTIEDPAVIRRILTHLARPAGNARLARLATSAIREYSSTPLANAARFGVPRPRSPARRPARWRGTS